MSEPDRMASTSLFTYLTQGVICDHQREPGGVAVIVIVIVIVIVLT